MNATLGESMEFQKNNVKIEWNALEDEPCYRFYVSKLNSVTKDWEDIDSASYCTCIEFDDWVCEKKLSKYLEIIMDAVYDKVQSGESIKRICQSLSWLN